MKLQSMEEALVFNELLDRCSGQVWMESVKGKRYNLKTGSERVWGLAELLGECAEEYEIYARKREDRLLLLGYFCDKRKKTA